MKYVTFHDSKKISIPAIAPNLFIFAANSWVVQVCLHPWRFFVHALFIPLFFLKLPLSPENMQNYLCFLKSFPLLYTDGWKDQGSVREPFDLSLCDDFTAIPLQPEKQCPCLRTSSLLLLSSLLTPFVLQFYPLLPDQDTQAELWCSER